MLLVKGQTELAFVVAALATGIVTPPAKEDHCFKGKLLLDWPV